MKNLKEFINEGKNRKLNFSNMIAACEDSFKSMKEVIDDLNDNGDEDLPEDVINGLFKDYEKSSFVGCVLSNNGYQGPLEDEFDNIWNDDESYLAYDEDALFYWDGNGCNGSICRYIDKNGHMMIIADMDPCRIYISK